MGNKLLISVLLLALLLVPLYALAQENNAYHLKLLAVQDNGDGYTGSDAELFLELKEGSGRVFLETTPLTKLDTQFSTRFAKEIACTHFKLPCEKYDFIYTIKAKSSIIGGPSAGAAIAALTTIAVLDLEHDEGITVTGTVNSGGIIGPVGGVKEKLDAAKQAGVRTVLVAQGSRAAAELSEGNNIINETVNIVAYGQDELGLDVEEVQTLDDVVLALAGVSLNGEPASLQEDPAYQQIMQGLAEVLCGRSGRIEEELSQRGITLDVNSTLAVQAKRESAMNASRQGDYYSAASFCFGSNIQLRASYYQQESIGPELLRQQFLVLERKVLALEQKVAQQPVNTISDLQTRMVVKERLHDVREQLQRYEDGEEEPAGILAYAEERYFSALSWMQFFAMDGKHYVVNEELLKGSCLQKISEADERHQYTALFLGEGAVQGIREKIETAKQAGAEEEYELCLITASQAKADANAILSSFGIEESNVQGYLDSKKYAAQRVIAENSEEGIFPILGYSYYQYANSLRGSEPFTALLYYEYALEMSELGMYFPEEEGEGKREEERGFSTGVASFDAGLPEKWRYALGGAIVGLLMGLGIMVWRNRRED